MQFGWSCFVWKFSGFNAAVRFEKTEIGSSRFFRAIRRHARRCDRPGNLFHNRLPDFARNFVVKKIFICLIALFVFTGLIFAEARFEILQVPGKKLKNNPLRDPVERRAAVFIPQGEFSKPLPVIYWLPGYGGSSESFIKAPERWQNFVQQLASNVTPIVFVVVDAKTRWGGSQYLNSPAQGNYADYVCDEIVPLVEARFPVAKNFQNRIIAGHSSGGFGALRLGMMRPKLFHAVIALSPDSDFPVTELSSVELPAVKNILPNQIETIVNSGIIPKNGDVREAFGLASAYSPVGRKKSGRFDWLYDEQGNFRQQVWQRWLENDPLTIVQKNKNAFRPDQKIYLEGAAQDQFKANIGAKAIYEILRQRKSPCTFYEPPGRHSDHLMERIERGAAWVYDAPLFEIGTNGIVRSPKN